MFAIYPQKKATILAALILPKHICDFQHNPLTILGVYSYSEPFEIVTFSIISDRSFIDFDIPFKKLDTLLRKIDVMRSFDIGKALNR